MRFTILLSLATLALSAPLEFKRQSGVPDAATITQLAPNLGFTAGRNPTGTGDCDGAVNGPDGKPIKVPCACPPAQDVYIAVRGPHPRFLACRFLHSYHIGFDQECTGWNGDQ